MHTYMRAQSGSRDRGSSIAAYICRGNVETTTVTTMFDVKVRNVCRCVCVKCIMNGSIGTSPLQYCLGALRPKLILHKCIHPLGVMLQALRINMCEHRNDSKKGKERERERDRDLFWTLGFTEHPDVPYATRERGIVPGLLWARGV